MMKAIKRILVLVSLVFAVAAIGENNKVCMGGDVEQLSAAQLHTCQTQVQQVRASAAAFHLDNWHFIVVCDESGWTDYAAFSEKSAEVLAHADADTNSRLRTTFFRGSHLNEQLSHEVLASEMAAITRGSSGQQIASN